MPQGTSHIKKFLLIADLNRFEVYLPEGIKREVFEIEEIFLATKAGAESNAIRKIGKNDSYTYSHEMKYDIQGEKIQKKRQITAREFIELMESRDKNKRHVKKIRQCFIYEGQYFMVETFVNIKPHPSCLLYTSDAADE